MLSKVTYKKAVVSIVSILCVVCTMVAATTAFLTDGEEKVENVFTASKVTTEVTEELSENVKSNVKIKNTGDIDAYIRAAVVVTWQDEKGNVYGKPVAEDDYEIEFDLSEQTEPEGKWTLAEDGFYYWSNPVGAGESTNILVKNCKPLKNAPSEGYYLNVEIIGSGIQSVPSNVVKTEWSSGVKDVSGTTLIIKY